MSPPKPEHHLVGLFVQKTVLESPLCAAVREEDRVPLVASPLAEELSRRARLEVRRSRDDAARSDQVLELAYFGDGANVGKVKEIDSVFDVGLAGCFAEVLD